MREKKRNGRPFAGLAAAVFGIIFLLALMPFGITARAETGHISGAASWKKAVKDGQAELSVQLVRQLGLGDITAIRVNVAFTAEDLSDVKSVEFTFDGGWDESLIREYVYDGDRGFLTIVIAGSGKIMEQANIRKLGTLKTEADGRLSVSVNGGEIVADGELFNITFVQNSSGTFGGSQGSSGSGSGGSSGGSTGGSGGSGSWGSGGGVSRRSSGGPSGTGSGGVYQIPSVLALETPGSWEKSGEAFWKFKLASGAYAKNTWVLNGGQWYHLGSDGIMNTGWYQEGGVWYLLAPDGHMRKGWQEVDKVWYYLGGDNGQMRTGWLYDGGYWYYLAASGAMCTGWQQIAGNWHYFNAAAPVPQPVRNTQTGQVEMSTAGQRPLGAMYAAAKTPDGYEVDSAGVRRQEGASGPAAGGVSGPVVSQGPGGTLPAAGGVSGPAVSQGPGGTLPAAGGVSGPAVNPGPRSPLIP